MPLYSQEWFINLVERLRRYEWFNKYIYGQSKNLEDFVRNPAEVLRETFFPFVVKRVKPYSVLMVRLGYLPADPAVSQSRDIESALGSGWKFQTGRWRHFIGVMQPWFTKYPNARFMFQLAVSIKYCVPIPYFSMMLRWREESYLQLGLGYGPELQEDGTYNSHIVGKLRLASASHEKEWNPADVSGYYDGSV